MGFESVIYKYYYRFKSPKTLTIFKPKFRTMNKLILAALCFTTLFFTNCNKNDDSAPPPTPTKTELITKSSWKFSTAFAGSTDVSSAPQLACFKDNIITFSTNLTGNINEGTNICSPTTAGPFTWNFANSENTLHISTVLISGGSNDFTLVSLSETQLVVSQNYPPYGTVTVTFIH
jgi:hypothetical protein